MTTGTLDSAARETAEAADIAAFLRQHPPYDRMEPDHLDFLAARLRPVRFAHGEAITDPEAGPAEWFYILRSGLVIGEEGAEDERISGNEFELVPGECFPIGALVANRPIRAVQRAEGAAICLALPRAEFNRLRELSPGFNEYCTHRLSGLIEKVNRKVRAEAAKDLGEDSSLNVTLKEKRLRKPMTSGPDATIREVLERMSGPNIGSMLIVDGGGRPVGIFTLRDLMNRVALGGVPYDRPISEVMTPDPITIPASAFAFEAAMRMADAGIHHIVVVEEERLTGIISERDLFSMQRVGLVNLARAIAAAGSTAEVARLAREVHILVSQMMAQGMKVGQMTQIITLVNDHIAVRLIELVLEEAGGAPFPFTWLAFGSEGRQEQTLKTDQDNGILFAPPEGLETEAARAQLMALAAKVNDALDESGFPLCTGGIMARNPDCCLTPDEWKARFSAWIDQGTPEHLLKGSIFFDFRVLWGDPSDALGLRGWLLERTRRNTRFQKQMAANALRNTPPLGLIGGFRLSGRGEQSRTIDLKAGGVTPFIDAMRIMALAHGVAATNTLARLDAVVEKGVVSANDAAAWRDAYDYIRLLRMRMNDRQAEDGKDLSNRVSPAALHDLDRRILKEAFREAKRLQTKLSLDYQI